MGATIGGMAQDLETVADRLDYAMRQRGLKAPELADRVGIKAASVYQWLSGSTKWPRPDHLLAAADALRVHPRWLISGEGEIWAEHDYNRLAAKMQPDDRARWRQVGRAFEQQGDYDTEEDPPAESS
jgi:transcriptional regulator with XRE-family HTH domain